MCVFSKLGPYKPTSITHGFQEVKLNSFERAAIYITLTTPALRYTTLEEGKVHVNDVIYDLSDLRILAGSGIKSE